MASYFIWFIVASLLLVGELLTGTFYLLAIAVGVAAGGIADLLGASAFSSLLITALVAILIFIVLRRYKRENAAEEDSLDRGQTVQILEWIDAQHARVQHRGTQWDAVLIDKTAQNQDLTDAIYEIVGQKSNTLFIRIKKEDTI